MEEEGFVSRKEYDSCFPVCLATLPSAPELREVGRQGKGKTPNTPQVCLDRYQSRGWGRQ